jgi:hypothetical protein
MLLAVAGLMNGPTERQGNWLELGQQTLTVYERQRRKQMVLRRQVLAEKLPHSRRDPHVRILVKCWLIKHLILRNANSLFPIFFQSMRSLAAPH